MHVRMPAQRLAPARGADLLRRREILQGGLHEPAQLRGILEHQQIPPRLEVGFEMPAARWAECRPMALNERP